MNDTGTLGGFLARCRSGLVAVFGFSLVSNLLMLSTAIYMLQVYDRVLTSHSTATLLYLTVITVAALALLGFFEVVRSRILLRIGSWLERRLSPVVYRRALDNAVVGTPYRTEGLRDLGTLRGFLAGNGITALFDAPWVPVYVFVIFLLHPMLGLFAMAGAASLFLLALANHLLTRRGLAQAVVASSNAYRRAEASFRNAEVIDGMGMAAAFARRWDAMNADVLALQDLASGRGGTLSAITKAFRLLLQVGVLGVGAYLVLQRELTPGSMVAGSIILGRALAPVELGIGAWKQLVGALEAWKRLGRLLAQKPLRPLAMALPRPKGHLRVEGVTYSPPGARLPVLKRITFEVAPGEVLAVIGPSAAGKSTLARVMVGIAQPQIGTVRLDGADIFTLNRQFFGQYVGYLPQDVELFAGTVRENIARMEEGDPDKVVAAATMADVHEMILHLPDGYETEIGEQGALLSGGQRQRIALARALYGNPALLVLDEPNASLDAAGEHALNKAIADCKSLGAAVILLAHRRSILTHVDRIAVLNAGELQLIGARDAVLERIQGTLSIAEQAPVRIVASVEPPAREADHAKSRPRLDR